MRAANKRFAAALRAGDVDAALAADDELHAIPVAAAGNHAMSSWFSINSPRYSDGSSGRRFSTLTGRGSVALHDKLISLCEAGQTEQAAAVSWETWQTPGSAALGRRTKLSRPPDNRHSFCTTTLHPSGDPLSIS